LATELPSTGRNTGSALRVVVLLLAGGLVLLLLARRPRTRRS
jgi:LPXTG-motif cell wall-anchored protein